MFANNGQPCLTGPISPCIACETPAGALRAVVAGGAALIPLHGHAAEAGNVAAGGAGWWLVGAAALGAGAIAWLAGRGKAARAKREVQQLRGVLEFADGLLWQAKVRLTADGWHWGQFTLQPTGLSRRLFAALPTPEHAGLWRQFKVPEQEEMNARCRRALVDGQKRYEQEFHVELKEGRTLWLRESVSISALGGGEFWLVGLATDITAQREAEESKRASEAQLQQVMTTADFLLWHARVFDLGGGELRWVVRVPNSTLYRKLFGVDPQPDAGLPWSELVDAATRADMERRANEAVLKGESGYEQEFAGVVGGETLWLNEQATIQRGAPGEWQLIGIVTDVTTRHRAEEARVASERALREILERADCLLWRANVQRGADGALKWLHFELPASRLSTELLGAIVPAASNQLWNVGEVPDLGEMNARSAEAINRGAAGYEQEFRAMRAGRLYWLHEQVSIQSVGPNEWRMVGVVTNVTKRHEAEEAQHRSEARLEELLRRADCLIWQGQVWRVADGRLAWRLYVPRSRLHRRIFGRDPDGSGFCWDRIGVPEFAQMQRTAEAALIGGAPAYEQVFHIPKLEGDIWVSEQVTINPVGASEWEVVGVITDITARRQAEEARRTTEAQLRQILELAECMVWEATATEIGDGRHEWKFYTMRSVMFRRLFGESATEVNFGWARLNVPELKEMESRAAEAIRRGDSGYEQEFRAIFDQRVVWLHEVVTILQVGAGQWRLVGVITDITAQREAQEAQKASQAQMEQMLETVDCLLWQARVFELTGGKLRWVMFVPRSHLYRALFGGDPGNPATLMWGEVVEAAVNDEIDARAANAILSGENGYEQEFRAQRGDRVFWLHEQVTIKALGPGEWQLVGVITDLSERRAAEQAVRASELRYRTLYQHTPVAIIEMDFSDVGRWLDELRASGVTDLAARLENPHELVSAAKRVRFVDSNDAAMKMLRAKTKGDFRHRRGALSTADSLRLIKAALLCLWEGRNTLETEIEMRDFEGAQHDMHVRWWMELNDAGLDLRQSVMVLVDLTELKQAQAALAAEKERLAVTLRAMAEGVITTDVDGVVQFMNPAAAAFTDVGPGAAIGTKVDEICLFENDRTGEPIELPVRRVTQGDVVIELPPRTRLVMRSGASRLVEGCCAPIHSATSTVIGTVLVFRDVTEHDRLEQELVRATKLESVGILAGGIAHDFNNILTAIMGNVALAALDVDPASEAGRSLNEAEKATLRARDLTQQLLTFAKGGEPVRAAVQLDAIVREMTTFTLHGSRVRADYEIAADLWPADADKGQIGRVVQNLVLNAVQAMPEGGTVKIALRNARFDGLSRLALAPGNYVQIAITDTGVGIKPEHLSRIFDPYFTTKQMGSGLGLAAVYSIVHKHRGTIDVDSQLGQGTTFSIWLPASREAVLAGGGEKRSGEAVMLKGRLLFMDDEESIRQMAVILLRRFGFDVACASDGAQAVRMYQEAQKAGQPFTLVMMDLTVPGGMGGREAIAQLRRADPEVRAIVSSGYSSDPVLANYREHGFCGVAAKPYEMSDLARVLREALGGTGAEEAQTRGK